MNEILLVILFFFIALFYSSIGFGGGSSYLALLSIVLISFYEIRTLALLLNICVVSIGTFRYLRQGLFDLKAFWPFLIFSIPLAYIGASLRLSETMFFLALGGALILAAIAMVIQTINKQTNAIELVLWKRSTLGGAIGLVSGLVGIGGGIFLSPMLNLLQWKNARIIAALASVFILVNSIAGTMGLIIAGTFSLPIDLAWKLIGAVVIGGLIGSQFSLKMNVRLIRWLTAGLVLYVGLRLILLHGFQLSM